jgi:hypothetical protein
VRYDLSNSFLVSFIGAHSIHPTCHLQPSRTHGAILSHHNTQFNIDNQVFKARRNLWLFLKQARRGSPVGLIWIDALCIDQENIGERNHQVSLMKDIYSLVCSLLVVSYVDF